MNSRVYINILKGSFRALGYFADELFSVESDKNFFRHIAHYIVPLIRKSPHFESFYFRWIKEKDRYLKDYARLQANIPIEVEQSFESLKLELLDSAFLEDPDVRHHIDAITTILETKKPSGIPSYIYAAEEKLQQLLLRLLRLGADKVVSNYGIIIKVNASGINHATGEWEYFDKDISSFSFAPSIIQLREMESIFSRKHNATDASWIAWEFLSLVEWCWNTPSSFFDDKTLSFRNYELGNESQYLLSLHADWTEINILKGDEAKHQPRVSFFERDRFAVYIKLVLNEVVLQQSIDAVEADVSDPAVISPYTLELKFFHFTKLVMEVCWFEHAEPIRYLIHDFKDGSKRHKFMDQLINASVRESISIPGTCDNIAQYFEDMQLNNMVGTLFFERVNTRTAARKCVTSKGSDISPGSRDDLKNFIKKKYRIIPDLYR